MAITEPNPPTIDIQQNQSTESLVQILSRSLLNLDVGMSGILAAVCASIFYAVTICPTVGFGDAVILIDAMKRGVLTTHVNNHPWTVATGTLFLSIPVGEIALRANLVSWFYGTLTIGFFHCAVAQVCSRRWIAWLFTAGLAVSHSMWWHSTIVENYATSAMAIAAGLCFWNRLITTSNTVWLFGLCVLGGLSISNHVENSTFCLGIATTGFITAWSKRYRVVTSIDRIKLLSGCALAACVGLVPWLYLLFQESLMRGSFTLAIQDAFVGKFAGTFFATSLLRALWDTSFVIWYQAPLGLLAICFPFGLYIAPKDSRFWGIVVHIALLLVIFGFYPTWDKFAFLLPGFVAAFFISAMGFEWLWNRAFCDVWLRYFVALWSVCSIAIVPSIYSLLPLLGQDPRSFWYSRFNNLHAGGLYRQSEYILNPNKFNYRDVADYCQAVFARLPKDAIYLDDDSRTYYPIAEYYQRYFGIRPDLSVLLVNSWGFDDWGVSTSKAVDIMERAYLSNRDFFVPALTGPYTPIISKAREKFSVEFAEYPLDAGRSIYRMQTATDQLKPVSNAEIVNRLGIRPIKADGVYNLNPLHVFSFAGVFYERQIMSSFGALWFEDDQVFVNASGPGAYLEFPIDSVIDEAVEMEVRATVAPDFGVLQVRLDNNLVGEVDLFSTQVQPKSFTFPVNLRKGVSVLNFRVIRKTESSSGFHFGLDTVTLTRK